MKAPGVEDVHLMAAVFDVLFGVRAEHHIMREFCHQRGLAHARQTEYDCYHGLSLISVSR
jgi:hypothetical protein